MEFGAIVANLNNSSDAYMKKIGSLDFKSSVLVVIKE